MPKEEPVIQTVKKVKFMYFLYSPTQHDERKKVEEAIGHGFVAGTVAVRGNRELFTELSPKPTNRYSDTKVVAQGDINNMTFTMPSSVTGRGKLGYA